MSGLGPRVGNPEKTRIEEVMALVDTGATLTVIPRDLAERLGLRVTGKASATTATGKTVLNRTRV